MQTTGRVAFLEAEAGRAGQCVGKETACAGFLCLELVQGSRLQWLERF